MVNLWISGHFRCTCSLAGSAACITSARSLQEVSLRMLEFASETSYGVLEADAHEQFDEARANLRHYITRSGYFIKTGDTCTKTWYLILDTH